jgi:UDP-N-acetylglucosamine acyltransferase
MTRPASIHPTAQVDPAAVIGANVGIGAYSVIGADVHVGEGTVIGPHVVIEGPTRIGRDNRIAQFASLGGDPQDKKFGGEHTVVLIGPLNICRYSYTNNGARGAGGVYTPWVK